MPRGGTFFKALCWPTVKQTCGPPAMCETGTVPEMVRRLDLPLLSRDGSIIWGSYAMAYPLGIETRPRLRGVMQREYNGTPSTGSRLMDRGPLPSKFSSTLGQNKGRVVLW